VLGFTTASSKSPCSKCPADGRQLDRSCGLRNLNPGSAIDLKGSALAAATTRAEIVSSYFEHLTASNIEAIVALFANDGFVESPVLGTVPAEAFFRKLGDASERNVLTVHAIMSSSDDRVFAAHFTYEWTLKEGGDVTFDGVDLFEFGDGDLLASMKIFYDTHPTRSEVGNKYERES